MILQVMRYCRNFFEKTSESGQYTIAGGRITLQQEYLLGQYILLTGSVLNNGLYHLQDNLYTLDSSKDEIFEGTIYGLIIPLDFLQLCKEIDVFAKSPAGAPGPYTSESVIGVHSYTKATGPDGLPVGWQAVFGGRISEFRKMLTEIRV